MRALVTGASGHLGAYLCRALLSDGFDVRAMVRPKSRLNGLNGLDIDVVNGDVLNRDSVAKAASNCNVVFHLGCPTSLESNLRETISKGTDNVLYSCLDAKVDRLVFTSSIVTVGYAQSVEKVLDERSNELTLASDYHIGKWHSEKTVLDFADKTGLDVVITNPATIIGAMDYRVTPSNAPIQQCLDKGLPFAFDSGLTVVHAEDVANGHLQAFKRGKSGERYILGGTRVTIPDYFTLISEVCGRRSPIAVLPRIALLSAGAAFSVLKNVGMSVPFGYRQADVLAGRYGWYSSEKAVEQLGYSWRGLRAAH
jgi:dihydroflavonol-4-reductase